MMIRLALLSLVLLMSSCGFHLRGVSQLPTELAPLLIQGDSGSLLVASLNQQLKSGDIAITEVASEANYRLIIGEQRSDRRTLSLGSDNRAAEYQLVESVSFELRDRQGNVVIGPRDISERRILSNDPNNTVSKSNEEALLRREMQRALAVKLLRQLAAVKPGGS